MKGTRLHRPPPAATYARYAVLARRQMEGPEFGATIAHWRARLAGLPPPLELPTDFRRTWKTLGPARKTTFTLPADARAAVARLGSRAGVTPSVVYIAAFKLLIHMLTNESDIVVGVPVLNRHAAVRNVFGLFATLSAYRTLLRRGSTVPELLRDVYESGRRDWKHRDVPFMLLCDAMGDAADLVRNALLRVVINVVPSMSLALDDVDLRRIPLAGSAASRPDVSIVIEDDESECTLTYKTDLFLDVTMQLFVRQFTGVVAQVVGHPEMRLADFTLST